MAAVGQWLIPAGALERWVKKNGLTFQGANDQGSPVYRDSQKNLYVAKSIKGGTWVVRRVPGKCGVC